MYNESWDCPAGTLELVLDELFFLQANTRSTAATLVAAVSHLVTVFMFVKF
jgi:hypothetical protein